MRIFLLSVGLLFMFSTNALSQYYWDVGFSAGGANYLGEMGGTDQSRRDFIYDIKLNQTRWMLGTFFRYRVNQNFSWNTSISYGRIQGADSLSDYPNRFGRNLSFRNDIVEVATRGELYFYTVNDVGRTGRYRLDFRTYVFGGLGMFYHNPQAFYQGKWHALQPLKTEGKTYSRVQPVIPIGGGFYYTYKRQHRIGWEFGWRITFTDYLDDASSFYIDPDLHQSELAAALANRSADRQNDPRFLGLDKYKTGSIRGEPSNNDSYLFTQFSYSFVLRGQRRNIRHKSYNYVYSKRKRRRTKAKF
ncbi:MAG: DUF6089 family protein [Salibacteraceae bacterium]